VLRFALEVAWEEVHAITVNALAIKDTLEKIAL